MGALRRFWFPVRGHLGIGVTTATLTEARDLAERVRADLWPSAPALKVVVEDVDVSTLDPGHVLPNIRPPVWPGVWFPIGWDGPPTGGRPVR